MDRPAREATIWLEDYCRCCHRWADYLIQAEYSVELRPLPLSALRTRRRELGIPEEYSACHTAVIDGLVVEGHVPLETVEAALREEEGWIALAVPDMPYGSPGMEWDIVEPYDVLGLRGDGTWTMVERFAPAEN
jgi:hypothetical protein